MDLMDAIRDRRSIRRYKPDPVPEEMIQAVLEAGRWAPSWANSQCCEVIVIKDPEVKSEISKTLPRVNPALSSMTGAPLIVVVCGRKEVAGYYGEKPLTAKGDWLMFDAGLTMQTLCLAAHALGLGTVVVGMFDHKKVAEILDVPPNVEVVAMTPLGYPASAGGSSRRKDISEFAYHGKYGRRDS